MSNLSNAILEVLGKKRGSLSKIDQILEEVDKNNEQNKLFGDIIIGLSDHPTSVIEAISEIQEDLASYIEETNMGNSNYWFKTKLLKDLKTVFLLIALSQCEDDKGRADCIVSMLI